MQDMSLIKRSMRFIVHQIHGKLKWVLYSKRTLISTEQMNVGAESMLRRWNGLKENIRAKFGKCLFVGNGFAVSVFPISQTAKFVANVSSCWK